MDKIRQLQDMINESNRIVFFGGAGVSTESNIPDFRSADGLYKQKYRYSPEQIVSHSFFTVSYTHLFCVTCTLPSFSRLSMTALSSPF